MRALQSFLGRYEAQIYAVMRFVMGFLFACHGAQKLFGVLGGKAVQGNALMMTAGIIEFGGGILIAIGLLTSLAAFIACGEMAVAYFKVHIASSLWPIANNGEKAALFCFIFLFITAHGAGIWSVDSVIQSKQS